MHTDSISLSNLLPTAGIGIALTSLQQRRLQTVQKHIEAKNRQDIDAVVAAFWHPRCELIALEMVSEGEEALREMLTMLYAGFPNLYTDAFAFHHADSAVVVEGRAVGTQLGACHGLPASGRVLNLPYVAIFEFDGDRLLCEKVYFDMNTVTRQLAGRTFEQRMLDQ